LAVRHGFEPTFRVFSPLPMIASSCVFIAFQYTQTINVCKHYLCICGKRREEKRVQIVCKKGGCANFVQIKLAPESVQTLCKDFGPPWRVAGPWRGPAIAGRVKSSVRGLRLACGQRRRLASLTGFQSGSRLERETQLCRGAKFACISGGRSA